MANKKKRKKRIIAKNPLFLVAIKEMEKLINAPRSLHQKYERLEYDAFYDLEFYRMHSIEELKESLREKCVKEYHFNNWVRCVPFQYSNNPLSSKGSVNSIGGRFNIGKDINEDHFTSFNALYIAEDETTALLEKYGVSDKKGLESAIEACFGKKENFTTVHLQGILHNVLDLDGKNTLSNFLEIIRKINYSHGIQQRLKKEGRLFQTVKTVSNLKKILYNPEWRFAPEIYDLPAGTQTFGQIAYRAGIEAILYTSAKNGKKCLAIFPHNLSDSSKIELSGSFPDTVVTSVLTSENYEETL